MRTGIDYIVPHDGVTLPRPERTAGLAEVHKELIDRVSKDVWTELGFSSTGVIATGALCTIKAMEALAQEDNISFSCAVDVSDELNVLGDYFSSQRISKRRSFRERTGGFWAEVAMTKAIWNGIAAGAIDGYAFLSGNAGLEERGYVGLRKDVDLRVKVNGKKHKVQVKKSEWRLSNLYAEGITKVSPQQLFEDRKRSSVARLMTLHDRPLDEQYEVYSKLEGLF